MSTKPPIYSEGIIGILTAHDYRRVDAGIDADFMAWKKGSVLIQFKGDSIICMGPEGKQTCLTGFNPNDVALFLVLMNSWSIITVAETFVLLKKHGISVEPLIELFTSVKPVDNGA